MKRLCMLLVLLSGLCLPLRAADPELAGNWVGTIDTTRGPMDIALNLAVDNGRLTGVLKTAHGDWEITGVTEKDGLWTVGFKGGGNEGRMIGRITGTRFAGEWTSLRADGTFEMVRVKKKS